MIKPMCILASFISISCFADTVPDYLLQAPYNDNVEQRNGNKFALDFSSAYIIPESTYRYLDSVFSNFYQKLSFNTSIANSTFTKNTHYELFAIPIIPSNKEGLQLELFGHFTDNYSQYLSNFSSDNTLYNYRANSENFDIYNSELSFGAGFSFNTSASSKFKIIVSNTTIPGYGTSIALFGFETRF
ncbi:MAG: hypothetical protein WBM99_13725 [Psychromonas sp.]